jgi:hypothetical protein
VAETTEEEKGKAQKTSKARLTEPITHLEVRHRPVPEKEFQSGGGTRPGMVRGDMARQAPVPGSDNFSQRQTGSVIAVPRSKNQPSTPVAPAQMGNAMPRRRTTDRRQGALTTPHTTSPPPNGEDATARIAVSDFSAALFAYTQRAQLSRQQTREMEPVNGESHQEPRGLDETDTLPEEERQTEAMLHQLAARVPERSERPTAEMSSAQEETTAPGIDPSQLRQTDEVTPINPLNPEGPWPSAHRVTSAHMAVEEPAPQPSGIRHQITLPDAPLNAASSTAANSPPPVTAASGASPLANTTSGEIRQALMEWDDLRDLTSLDELEVKPLQNLAEWTGEFSPQYQPLVVTAMIDDVQAELDEWLSDSSRPPRRAEIKAIEPPKLEVKPVILEPSPRRSEAPPLVPPVPISIPIHSPTPIVTAPPQPLPSPPAPIVLPFPAPAAPPPVEASRVASGGITVPSTANVERLPSFSAGTIEVTTPPKLSRLFSEEADRLVVPPAPTRRHATKEEKMKAEPRRARPASTGERTAVTFLLSKSDVAIVIVISLVMAAIVGFAAAHFMPKQVASVREPPALPLPKTTAAVPTHPAPIVAPKGALTASEIEAAMRKAIEPPPPAVNAPQVEATAAESAPVKEESAEADPFVEKFTSAEKLMKRGKTISAFKSLTALAAEYPDRVQIFDRLALIEYERGHLPQAKQHAEHAITLDDNAPYSHMVLGALAQENNQRDAARASYQKFLRLCPSCQYVRDIRAALSSL